MIQNLTNFSEQLPGMLFNNFGYTSRNRHYAQTRKDDKLCYRFEYFRGYQNAMKNNTLDDENIILHSNIFRMSEWDKYITADDEFLLVSTGKMSSYIYNKDNQPIRRYAGYVQFQVNTTEYFMNPDGSRVLGMMNDVISYECPDKKNIFDSNTAILYILPGQIFEIIYTVVDDIEDDEYIIVSHDITRLTGDDCRIANDLLEKGITVDTHKIEMVKGIYKSTRLEDGA